jgi:hypothetical protein
MCTPIPKRFENNSLAGTKAHDFKLVPLHTLSNVGVKFHCEGFFRGGLKFGQCLTDHLAQETAMCGCFFARFIVRVIWELDEVGCLE